jgi:hypothetical protein
VVAKICVLNVFIFNPAAMAGFASKNYLELGINLSIMK